MVLLNLFADIVDIVFNFLALIPAIGVVMFLMAPIISFSVFAITEFWLIMKGGMGFRKQISIIAGNILDVIPLLSFLPIKTAGVLIAIYMINHPEIGKVASMATGKIPLKTAAAAE